MSQKQRSGPPQMRLVLGGFPEIADMSDEARAAAERVQRQPNFTGGGRCPTVGAVAVLADPLIEAFRSAGLPDEPAFGG